MQSAKARVDHQHRLENTAIGQGDVLVVLAALQVEYTRDPCPAQAQTFVMQGAVRIEQERADQASADFAIGGRGLRNDAITDGDPVGRTRVGHQFGLSHGKGRKGLESRHTAKVARRSAASQGRSRFCTDAGQDRDRYG